MPSKSQSRSVQSAANLRLFDQQFSFFIIPPKTGRVFNNPMVVTSSAVEDVVHILQNTEGQNLHGLALHKYIKR